MEVKIPGIIPNKTDVIIDRDDIINWLCSLSMKLLWPIFKQIFDKIKISELSDQQKTYLQTELKKLQD